MKESLGGFYDPTDEVLKEAWKGAMVKSVMPQRYLHTSSR